MDMAGVMTKPSNGLRAAQALHHSFASYYMRRHPEWNRLGPPLPVWFKRAIRSVDRRLVLQFIPPKSLDPRGLPGVQFARGAWYVCAKLRRNRKWISKRAVFALIDEYGQPVRPTRDIIRLLREAKKDRHRDGGSRLEKAFEDYMENLERQSTERGRRKTMEVVVDTMRRMNMRSSLKPKVLNVGIPNRG